MGNTGIAITMKLIKLCDFPGYFPHNKTCVLVIPSKVVFINGQKWKGVNLERKRCDSHENFDFDITSASMLKLAFL